MLCQVKLIQKMVPQKCSHPRILDNWLLSGILQPTPQDYTVFAAKLGRTCGNTSLFNKNARCYWCQDEHIPGLIYISKFCYYHVMHQTGYSRLLDIWEDLKVIFVWTKYSQWGLYQTLVGNVSFFFPFFHLNHTIFTKSLQRICSLSMDLYHAKLPYL